MPDITSLVRTIAKECYGQDPLIEAITRFNNPVYRLRFADGCKILKFAKTGAAVSKELMLLDLVQKYSVPAPIVEHYDCSSRIGRPFFIMDSAGEHTVADYLKSPDVARGLLTQMGMVMARIHTIEFPSDGHIRHDGIVHRNAQDFLGELFSMADMLVKLGWLVSEEAHLLRSAPFPDVAGRKLCHSDFHTVQCIAKGGTITAVVDWESAWSGNALIDLAITHAYLDFYCPPELIRCFFDGYTDSTNLPKDYDVAFLPVRMAHVIGLLRAWYRQGRQSWEYAVQQNRARKAIQLYQAYCSRWRTELAKS